MIDAAFINTITIKERTQTGTDDWGDPVYSYTDRYTSIPARVENYDAKTEYNEPGQRFADKKIVYLQPIYSGVQEQDKVVQDGVQIGIVSGINNAVLGISAGLDHIELVIEPE